MHEGLRARGRTTYGGDRRVTGTSESAPPNAGGLDEAAAPYGYVTTRRLREQRWLLEATIRQIGVDWDQGRSRYTAYAAGIDAEPDFQRVRERVKKLADIHREFASAAARREALSEEAERDGRLVEAREHAFVASILWGNAQWPLFGNSPRVLELGQAKVRCFDRYIRHAPRPTERVEIPYLHSSLPGVLHVPTIGHPPYPLVIQIGGMDSFKEHQVAMYGDKVLERGIARLAMEIPGQGVALERGLFVTATSAAEAGRVIFDWARARPDLRPDGIVLAGNSFGSFWATQIAAAVDGLAGCAVSAVIHQPGAYEIFETASPTFKARFMYMTGLHDEDAFDTFARTLDLRDVAGQVECPYLVLAGEDDELSPIQHTLELARHIRGPVDVVIYRGERHSIGSGPAAAFGPNRHHLVAGWAQDRQAGKPARDRFRVVDVTGAVHEREPVWRQ
jgi:alpha/beta superfamily hydrolase